MQAYTEDDKALITDPNVEVVAGAELLDQDDVVIADISEYVTQDGDVEHDNTDSKQGSCDFRLTTELDWSSIRVRLYQTLTSPSNGPRRFDLGVYILTTPDRDVGESPATYSVQGFDKMYLLQHEVGDTYVVAAGTNYLAAVVQVLDDAGVTGAPPLLDGTASAKTLPAARVWHGTVQAVQWLKVVNDLLKDIGYCPLYADESGVFRSKPDIPAAVRGSEWTFDLTDDDVDIVNAPRNYATDSFDAINHWTFIRDGLDFAPAEGSGIYTVDRTAGGVKRPKVVRLTAADQDSLEQQGDVIVAEDTQKTATWSLTCGPLPVLGHRDVVTLVDPEVGTFKLAVSSYTIPLDGGDVSLKLEVV